MSVKPDVVNVVDRYIAVEIVKDLNADLGWRAEHRLSQLMDYLGDLPDFQGGGGNSNGAMIHQLSMAFDVPNDPKTLWSCKAMEILKDRSKRNHDVLVAYVLLRHRPDPLIEGSDGHTLERIACAVGITRKPFYTNLQAAEAFISDLLVLHSLRGKMGKAA